jgi:hypothetical protein|tara:strand:- start:2475 stop:3233 length:759 start_codon:yes stop_codon:yes gene_type:complete
MENFKTIKGKNHYLYSTIEEFKTQHPNLEPGCIQKKWRFGNTGDWVLTDDDYVVQVLKAGYIKRPNGQKVKYIRTVCGSFLVKGKKEMCGLVAENIYTFSGTNEYKRFLSKNDTTSKEILFAQYVAKGVSPVDAYLKIYGTKNEKYAQQQSGRLLKTERMQKMIREEIQLVLNEESVSLNYIVRRFKQVADGGKRDGDVLRSLESLAKISGLYEQEQSNHQELTVWGGFSAEQLAGVKNEQVLLHADNKENV